MKIAIVEDEKKWQHIVKREVESYKCICLLQSYASAFIQWI